MCSSHLVGHDHGGAPVDAQDRKLRLDGQEVQDLGHGFLVRAVGKHHPMETGVGEQLTHLLTHTPVSPVCVCVYVRMCKHVCV